MPSVMRGAGTDPKLGWDLVHSDTQSMLLCDYMSNTVLTFFFHTIKQFDKVPDALWIKKSIVRHK